MLKRQKGKEGEEPERTDEESVLRGKQNNLQLSSESDQGEKFDKVFTVTKGRGA